MFTKGARVAVVSGRRFNDGPPRRGVVVKKARSDGTFVVPGRRWNGGSARNAGPESVTARAPTMIWVTGDKVVVIKTGRTGVVASISGAQWYRVVMDDTRGTPAHDELGENFRPSQIRKRGLEKPSPDIVEGARVIIENDAPSRLVTPKGRPPRVGRGTIVEVRSGGWRVVQYDQGTGRGRRRCGSRAWSHSCRRARLHLYQDHRYRRRRRRRSRRTTRRSRSSEFIPRRGASSIGPKQGPRPTRRG